MNLCKNLNRRSAFRWFSLFLSVAAVVGIPRGLSARWPVDAEADCPVRVTLLQVNDVYQFPPVDGGQRGGLARILTLRKQIMKESPNTLFLLAGDTISPSVESNTYK